ncbi:hypothetical protein [Ruminococcus champanellensis]|uniref:hypothetical protein n=1 Tax=Ruminococcus champanellensis TaxID=1161942 RepID=UPI003AB8A359
MINKSEIEKATGIRIAMSGEMRDRIRLGRSVLCNAQSGVSNRVRGLRLPVKIVDEFARLILFGASVSVSGSRRGAYIDRVLQQAMTDAKKWVRLMCATGGVVLRPVYDGHQIRVNYITADKIYPISYDDDGRLISAVFLDTYRNGDRFYHKLEIHEFHPNGTGRIRNQVFQSPSGDMLGDPCSLRQTGLWADLEPERSYVDLGGPLFAYLSIPAINTVDPDSPMGMSVYAEAVDLIRDADQHWEKIKWEFEATQTAIDAPADFLKPTPSGLILPDTANRLYRRYNADPSDAQLGLQIFSPQIRDTSLFHGLDGIFKRIEFNCNLAYGMLSDPQNVEKTAEEVRASRQRCYSAISDIQGNIRAGLRQLTSAINDCCAVYQLTPQGRYHECYEFGDGVMEDPDKEFARRMQMHTAGLLSDTKFIAWYFDCDESKAAEYKAAASTLFAGGDI